MARRKKATRSRLELIRDELATISSDVTSLGNTLGDVAADEAWATIKSVRDRLNRIASDARTTTRAGVGAIQDTIEERPFTSIAVALGVEFILAHMLRR